MLAQAHANRAVHRSVVSTQQSAALAAAVVDVFKADAVTLYARPRRTKTDLHKIAATGPFLPAGGAEDLRSGAEPHAPVRQRVDPPAATEQDVELLPQERSLLPSSDHVGDSESYVGILAARPGQPLRRNLYRDSQAWLKANGWPDRASPRNREFLPRTVGADPKLLGAAMPAKRKPENPAMAVAVVVRSSERPPYTAWDQKALELMLRESGHGVICSWRDWYAAMNAAGGRRSDLPGWIAMPLPRVGTMSLQSVLRELTAAVHDSVNDALGCVYQAWILAERPGARPMSVVPISYFSEFDPVPPQRGRPCALDGIPDLDWDEPFAKGGRRVFSGPGVVKAPSGPDQAELCRRVCVPWKTWTGHQMCAGLLVVDLTQHVGLTAYVMNVLAVFARKTAAALAVAGTTLDHAPFGSWTDPEEFARALRVRLGCQSVWLELKAGAEHRAWPRAREDATPEDSAWSTPHVVTHEPDGTIRFDTHCDAESWGVREALTADGYWLSVPLYFGMNRAGSVLAYWLDGPPTDVHGPEGVSALGSPSWSPSLWVRDVVAAWSLWSWSWSQDARMGWIREDILGLDDPEARFHWQITLTTPREGRVPDPEPDSTSHSSPAAG